MYALTSNQDIHEKLYAGDWVTVRSREEILSTLDERGRFDGMPFQPEMFEFCGQKLKVLKVAHKTCDTIHKTGGRRLHHTVHLDSVRCDGSAHGDCQASCLLFWKTAWLRPADEAVITEATQANESIGEPNDNVVNRNAQVPSDSGATKWSCQATALYDATEPINWWDMRQYIEDVTTRNHSGWYMIKLLTAAGYRKFVDFGIGYRLKVSIYNGFQKLFGGQPFPVGEGHIENGRPTPDEELGLRAGDWVEVKTGDEIRATLNRDGFNRGMRFDVEMLKFCGGRYRVQQRVERIINEETGKMMQMKSSCIQLENVHCKAECSAMRLGCPRAITAYWREIWLKRVNKNHVAADAGQ